VGHFAEMRVHLFAVVWFLNHQEQLLGEVMEISDVVTKRPKQARPSKTKLGAAYVYSSSTQNSVSTFSRLRMLCQIFGTGMLAFWYIKDGD
jgi:hypothetical protein